eukprot:scaffold12325_cov19-Tisochrysis_lutea.AAC.1
MRAAAQLPSKRLATRSVFAVFLFEPCIQAQSQIKAIKHKISELDCQVQQLNQACKACSAAYREQHEVLLKVEEAAGGIYIIQRHVKTVMLKKFTPGVPRQHLCRC